VFAQPGVKKRTAKSFRIEQQTGPAAVWQVKSMDVALGASGRPRHRLLLARNRQTGEIKYFITNAPRRIGIRRVLVAAFVRWNVEQVFRVAKSERGLPPFAGRSYGSLQRPMALCLVALAFVRLHTMQLRGEKSSGDCGASLPSVGSRLSEIPEPQAGDDGNRLPVRPPPVPSKSSPAGTPLCQGGILGHCASGHRDRSFSACCVNPCGARVRDLIGRVPGRMVSACELRMA
jgi:hypothetical protein